LDEMIEQERQGAHGDPEAETRLWLGKLAEVDRQRARHQQMSAEDLIAFDELKAHTAESEETRRMADRALRTLRGRQEQIRQLERDKQTLLAHYADLVPDALDGLDAAEHHRVYGLLGVEALVAADGSLEVSGDVISVCEMELLPI
jgi:hypothetical protein